MKLWNSEFNLESIYGGKIVSNSRIRNWGVEVVVGTLGRLVSYTDKGILKLNSLKYLVIDEAHEMMEEGFLDQLRGLKDMIDKAVPAKPKVTMLSATFPPEVKDAVNSFFGGQYKLIDMTNGQERQKMPSTLKHLAIQVPYAQRAVALKSVLAKFASAGKKALVFLNTKRGARDLGSQCHIPNCQVLYGDMSQQEREDTLMRFKSGKVSVLISTNVAARGIDVPNLDLVVQVEADPDAEVYVHRTGRTARVGRNGTAVTMWDGEKEGMIISKIERVTGAKFSGLKYNSETKAIEDDGKEISFKTKFSKDYDNQHGSRGMRGKRPGNTFWGGKRSSSEGRDQGNRQGQSQRPRQNYRQDQNGSRGHSRSFDMADQD